MTSQEQYFEQFTGKELVKVWIVCVTTSNGDNVFHKCYSRIEAELTLKKYPRTEFPHQSFYEDWETE